MPDGLYDIAQDYSELVDTIALSDDDHAVALLMPVAEEVGVRFSDKVDACIRMRQNHRLKADRLKGEAQVLEAEAKRLRAAAASRVSNAERLNEYMKACLLAGGVTSVETSIGKVFTKRTKKLVIPNEELVAGEFFEMRPRLDKKALRKALDDGATDVGASLEETTQIALR